MRKYLAILAVLACVGCDDPKPTAPPAPKVQVSSYDNGISVLTVDGCKYIVWQRWERASHTTGWGGAGGICHAGDCPNHARTATQQVER